MASLLAGQPDTPAGQQPGAEINRLVRQLDSPQLAQREAAEAALLKRGPAILDLLPPAAEPASAEVQQRLVRIRQKLQQEAARASVKSSTIALHADAMPLKKILAAFQRQSGNTIVDDRGRFGQPAADPKLAVRFDQTPFWPALDRVLDQAGLTVYPFSEHSAINVVAAGEKQAARAETACYSGPFRFEPVSVLARRDLRETDGQSLVVSVEAAWEPRLRIIGLLQRMADVMAVDPQGRPLPMADREAQLEIPVTAGAMAVKFDLPLKLPARKIERIAALRGKLMAMIPGRIETFRFSRLAGAKNLEQRIAGVTVTLDEVCKSNESWEVRILVRFDDAGDALASHRTWIFNNEAFLEGADGKPIAYDTFETTHQDKNEVGVAYTFNTEQPLDKLTFVFKTPGVIITRGFDYEFKDIRLP
jgi:hypothetical protein